MNEEKGLGDLQMGVWGIENNWQFIYDVMIEYEFMLIYCFPASVDGEI